MSTKKDMTINDLQLSLMQAASMVNVLGWAAVGQGYAGEPANINHKLTDFDIQSVAEAIHDLLLNISNDFHSLEMKIEKQIPLLKKMLHEVQTDLVSRNELEADLKTAIQQVQGAWK